MEPQVLINYFAREGYWRHIQSSCAEVLRKRAGDPVLLFWKAFGSIQEGSFSEALRELDFLQGERDSDSAVIAASLYAHSQSSLIDEEAVSQLKTQLSASKRSPSETSLLQAALFHFHLGPTGNLRKANSYLDQLLRLQPQNAEARCLKAWISLSSAEKGGEKRGSYGGRSSGADKALAGFEEVLSENERHLEAMLGRAKCWEVKKEYGRALEQINQVIVAHSWFIPGLTEKAKLLIAVGDWEQAMEVAQRVLTVDPSNIEGLRLSALYLLSHERRPQAALKLLSDLLDSIDRTEPRNAAIYFDSTQPLARLAGRSSTAILQKTLSLVDRACKLAPGDARYIAEYGYQQLLLGEVAGALRTYRRASQLDEMNMDAVCGSLFCQVALGQLQEAASQLEFLSEMSTSTDPSPPLLFLSATLARLKDIDHAAACALLDQAVEAQIRVLRRVRPGLGFYAELEPDRMLDAAREFLAQGGTEPRGAAEPASTYVSHAVKVLDLLQKAAPGLLDVQLLLGRARYMDAHFEGARRAVAAALRLDPASAQANVLQSQIFLAQGKYKAAASELEQAVAHDFCVRNSPHYAVVLAKVHLHGGEPEEAVKVLESAMSLPGVKHVARRQSVTSSTGVQPGAVTVDLSDRVDIYLTLAAAQLKRGHVPEATKVIQDAMNEFAGTAEEVPVIIANCELSLSRGDADVALSHLRSIPADSPQFVKAKVAMADILLKHRGDAAAFALCYAELAEKFRTPQVYSMLGEAYLRIQEPGKAIAAFQEALKKHPDDPALVSRIGRALVQTHSYSKAVAHYAAALGGSHVAPSPDKSAMQFDLAQLYFKLKRLEESERMLAQILARRDEDGGDAREAREFMQDVQALLLLAKVHQARGAKVDARDALARAREAQESVLAKTRLEQPETVRAQKQIAADICLMLARDSEGAKAPDAAAGFYHEGLKQSEGHVPTMLSLARLYLQRGDLDSCQQQCTALLRADATNADASLMIADLMCRKEQYDSAVYHYQQLLEKSPCNYGAVHQLIQLMRRCGRLPEVPPLFKNAEKANPHAEAEAGYHFCKGMHARYACAPNEAVKELNQARRDSEWNVRASYAMAEIYLNPENENLWEEGQGDAVEKSPGDTAEAIKAAKNLLQEIAAASKIPFPLRHVVLESYALMASKQKADIEAALAKLHEVVKDDMDSAPGLLATATGLMLLKQSPKAKNILKRIQKMSYTAEDGDELERGWLMLADVYIHAGKTDAAQDLCSRCIRYNKSCGKAWEYLGRLLEKGQSYKEAAEKYQHAWKHVNEASPSVGYRLAYTYLKAKRLTEAIDVSHKVIKASPNYPKIRKDVLEKARSQLRL